MRNQVWRDSGTIGMLLAGLLITAFPATAIGAQYHRLNSGTTLRLTVDSIKLDQTAFAPKYVITTPLNRVSTTHLTGDNHFVENDEVFMFMSPGPTDIWYPYAISKRPPEFTCAAEQCLILQGRVTGVARDSLQLRYAFETLTLPRGMRPDEFNGLNSEVDIQVGKNGQSTLRTLKAGDRIFDQRNLLSWVPPGTSNLGASKTPAINPPR